MKLDAITLIRRILALITLTSVLIMGCKKDKSDEKIPVKLLTDQIWRTSPDDTNPSTNPAGEILYTNTTTCVSDNTLTFRSDGICSLDRGILKCYNSELTKSVGEYTIDLENKKISILNSTYELLELSETQLKFAQPVDIAGYQYLVYVYRH